MNARRHSDPLATGTSAADAAARSNANGDLDDATRTLVAITHGLKSAYEALEQRAQRVEAELERTNRELAAILEALPTGVIVRDGRGTVVRSNRAATELLGATHESLTASEALAALENAPGATVPVTVTGSDGEPVERRLHSRAANVIGQAGEPIGTLVIVDDRTELDALTERLLVQDKMAALGTLAAGIAHEIRNPLNAIGGFAGLLEKRLDEPTAVRWAGLIGQGSREIESIVTGLVTMAGGESVVATTVSAHELVEAAVDRVLAHTDGASAWSIERDVRVDTLEGDEVKLRQALRNLVDNALVAQPDGGRIVVRVAPASDGSDAVDISVDDDGPGVPAELRKRVLEPFYTSRAEGTGLGLALTHTIVQLHGGSLSIKDASSPLTGARFSLRIPNSPTGR
ncbi:Sporulation kinase E [Planctomycetes bacterium Pla163]|uniref:histidine kinase n=1 Tax=Rohdeia mirabilis TaxID=2528008 RepID=A0A518D4U2_9BACT|nr:Sporulation kinase E [Planctomycetes bacterium Pla163]